MKIPSEAQLGKQSLVESKPGLIQNKPEAQHNPPVKAPSAVPLPASPPGFSPERAEAGLVSLLKLPQDGLSRSLIAFARFFSLPLESKLLTALRREVLGSKTTVREAAALGAAAAADKGIKLGEKALNEYAAAIEGHPESFAREDSITPHSSPESNAPENRQSNDGAERDSGQGPEDHTADDGKEAGTGERNDERNSEHDRRDGGSKELQRRITKILEERPSLDLINRIPGKNGRWVVVPFSFCEGGLEFTVSLRILLNRDSPSSGKSLVSGRLSADIKVSRLGREQRRWLVTLEKTEEKPGVQAEVSAFSASGHWNFSETEKHQIRQELAAALKLPLDRVSVREGSPLFADSRENILRRVDEEV